MTREKVVLTLSSKSYQAVGCRATPAYLDRRRSQDLASHPDISDMRVKNEESLTISGTP